MSREKGKVIIMNETNTDITKNKLKKTVSKKLEWDFNVPDYKNDILKICDTAANGYITDYTVSDGLVTAKVTVKANMLYIPDVPEDYEPKLSSLESSESFVIKADIPKNAQWDFFDVDFHIKDCTASAINSRKAGIRANGMLTVTLVKNSEMCAHLPENVTAETKTKKICAVYIPAMITEKINFSHTFSIPSGKPDIKELLRCTVLIGNAEVKAVANKAVLKGDMTIKLLYISSQNTPECFEFTSPFTEIADAKGLGEGMEMMYSAVPVDITTKVYSDGDNCQRNIDVNGYTLFKLTAFVKKEPEIICDAFCPGYEDECIREEICCTDISRAVKDAYTLKETIYASDSEFTEICDISAKVTVKEAVLENRKINISSEALFTYIYKSPAGIKCEQKPIDFDFSQDIPDGKDYSACEVMCDVCGTSFVISSKNSAEIRCNMVFTTRLFANVCENAVTEVKVNVDKKTAPKKAAITAYYPCEKEDVFSIAKKYRTTVESVKKENNLTEDYVLPGTFVIIV